MFTRSTRRTVSLLAAAAVTLAACGSDGDESSDIATDTVEDAASGDDTGSVNDAETTVDNEPTTPSADDDTASAGNDELLAEPDGDTPGDRSAETIDWSACGSGDCGIVTVPADYDDVGQGTIDIAVSVHRATGDDADWLGYLFVNPGGPGGSGIEFAASAASGVFTAPVLERFDVVGFDPRGVGASGPAFTCGDGSAYRSLTAEIDGNVDTDAEVTTASRVAALCGDAMGPVGNRLHTAYVANDMDLIREALGVEQISYYGGSYGSAVGAWFATLHPGSVRAMVVDGADNPITEDSDDIEVLLANQIEEVGGFETQLTLALDSCSDDACPIFNDGDPSSVLARAAAQVPLVAEASLSGSPNSALIGLITPLYAEDRWGELYAAIGALADDGDPGPLARLADEQLGDVAGPTITSHVNCLDAWALQPDIVEYDPADLELAAAVEARLVEELPLIGQFVADDFDACPFLRDLAPEPLERPFDGSEVPIVVIGNISDPATPFVESEELALEVLSNGYLVRVDHPSHVVYPGGPNVCVNGFVEAMLIDAQPPTERVTDCGATDGAAGPVIDPAVLIEELCFGYADATRPEADPEAVAAACADAPGVILDALGPELVTSIANGGDEDRVPELLGLIDEQFAEVGID